MRIHPFHRQSGSLKSLRTLSRRPMTFGRRWKLTGNKLIKEALKWLLCQMIFLKCPTNHSQIYVINRRWLQIYGPQISIVACSHVILPHEPVGAPKLSSAEPSLNLNRRSSKENQVHALKEIVLVVLVCLSYYWTKALAWCQQEDWGCRRSSNLWILAPRGY